MDLGCGNGRLVKLVEDKQVDYLGVDASENLIKTALHNYPDKKFQVMDALNLDLAENSVDVVICVSVLNHLDKANHQKFIENIKKVLKPGGILLMSNWNLWNINGKKSVWRKDKVSGVPKSSWKDVWTIWHSHEAEAPLYYYAFTKGELVRLLKKNKFEIEKAFYSYKGAKSNIFSGHNIITIAKNSL